MNTGGSTPGTDGRMETVVTDLEMCEPPVPVQTGAPEPGTAEKLRLVRAEKPTVAFYRFLYDTVGGPWLWWERRAIHDRDLVAIIHDPLVEIYVLYRAGVLAGFAELDRRTEDVVEIAYLGLMTEFIGRGLGRDLLRRIIALAWSRNPERVRVHTCTLDHPSALAIYQNAGFTIRGQKTQTIRESDLRRAFTGSLPNATQPGTEAVPGKSVA